MPNIINLKNKIEKPKTEDRVEESVEQVEKKEAIIEKAPEKITEKIQEKGAKGVEERAGGAELAGLAAKASIQQKRKERKKQVESILTKDLKEIYLGMTPEKQQEFKKAGEEAVEEINSLLEKTKVKIKKIINVIRKWLAVIPGVNKYFLEQESKIKADEIFKLKS